MRLLWTELGPRTAGLALLQMLLLVWASSGDGILSLMAAGMFLLPTTLLLLLTGYQAIMRGYWISAFFAILAAFPGLVGVLFGLLGLSAALSR